mgnify:CR=1 FL=1
MRYVLASASPRRKQLLAELIKEFEIIPSQAEETVFGNPSPKSLVAQLAALKAEEVVKRPENEGKIVIGSDTVVAFGKKVLGKPKDEEDAVQMLKLLSDRDHQVMTGMTVLRGERALTTTEITDIHFRELTDREILGYREVMGLTPKSLRRLRGATDAAGDADRDPITERLDRIAARVESYAAPEAHSLDPEEAQNYAGAVLHDWSVSNSDTFKQA